MRINLTIQPSTKILLNKHHIHTKQKMHIAMLPEIKNANEYVLVYHFYQICIWVRTICIKCFVTNWINFTYIHIPIWRKNDTRLATDIAHIVEITEFCSHVKKFREIIEMCNIVLKALISWDETIWRNFCKSVESKLLKFPHCVSCVIANSGSSVESTKSFSLQRQSMIHF